MTYKKSEFDFIKERYGVTLEEIEKEAFLSPAVKSESQKEKEKQFIQIEIKELFKKIRQCLK